MCRNQRSPSSGILSRAVLWASTKTTTTTSRSLSLFKQAAIVVSSSAAHNPIAVLMLTKCTINVTTLKGSKVHGAQAPTLHSSLKALSLRDSCRLTEIWFAYQLVSPSILLQSPHTHTHIISSNERTFFVCSYFIIGSSCRQVIS